MTDETDKVTDAVVLAGGRGTRLQPLTDELPKPLVKIGDRPIVEILLARLKQAGIANIRMAVNHLADQIMAALGDGSRLGVNLSYSHEDSWLSTVGPLKLIDNLPDHFLVTNGDILTDLDFQDLYRRHRESGAALTVATQTRVNTTDFGVFDVGSDGFATGFREKPSDRLIVSMGVYVFSREVLAHVPAGRPYGFDELTLDLLAKRIPIATYSYDGYWLDIGRPEDYLQAQFDTERFESWLRD